jgi:hypothetical protein
LTAWACEYFELLDPAGVIALVPNQLLDLLEVERDNPNTERPVR